LASLPEEKRSSLFQPITKDEEKPLFLTSHDTKGLFSITLCGHNKFRAVVS